MKNWLFAVIFVMITAITSAEGTHETTPRAPPVAILVGESNFGAYDIKIYRWEYQGKIYLIFIAKQFYGLGISIIEVKP